MGIEARKGKRYLYERRRINGRLCGVYLCPISPLAERLFREQARLARLRREAERQEAEDAASWAADVLNAGAAYDRLAAGVFRAGMILTGYALHKRADWRRKRGVTPMMNLNELLPKPRPRGPAPALIRPTGETPEVQKLLDRAATGDPSALPEVRHLLTQGNYRVNFGSVAGWARRALVRVASGDNLAVAEAVNDKLTDYLTELLEDSGPRPALVERMAATRVAHNWLTVGILETKLACLESGSAQAVAIDKQLTRAERRLHASMKALTILRRLRHRSTTPNAAARVLPATRAG